MKYIGLTISVLMAAMLAACGGGSSSSGGGKPPATISITTANADTVAKGAMTSNDSAQAGTTTAGLPKAAGLVGNLDTISNPASLAIFNTRLAQKLPVPVSNGTKAVTSYTFDCTALAAGNLVQTANASNIITYTINDADNSTTTSSGDTVTYAFTSCVLGSVTINGSQTLRLNNFSTYPTPSPSTPESASITETDANLTFTVSAGSIVFNGDQTLSYTYDGTTISASMSGSSYSVSVTPTGGSTSSVTFSNFSFTATSTSTIWTTTVDLTITMSDGTNTGTVNISTPTKFTGNVNSYPTSGQMKIEGANGSYITITADGTANAAIVIFDGTTTTNKTIPWSQL